MINLDGLTNSWDFQQALAEDRLAGWLTDRGVNAYVSPPAPQGGMALLTARAGLSSAPQTIRLHVEPMRDASPAAPTAPTSGGIAVWQVTGIEK